MSSYWNKLKEFIKSKLCKGYARDKALKNTRVGPYWVTISQQEDEGLGDCIARVIRLERDIRKIPGGESKTDRISASTRVVTIYVSYKYADAMLQVVEKYKDKK